MPVGSQGRHRAPPRTLSVPAAGGLLAGSTHCQAIPSATERRQHPSARPHSIHVRLTIAERNENIPTRICHIRLIYSAQDSDTVNYENNIGRRRRDTSSRSPALLP